MSVYIVEDSALKASKLTAFVADAFPEFGEPLIFGSFQSGLRAIEESPPRLVLMDMTLPTFDRRPNSREGRSRPLGGYEIMRKMVLKGLVSKVIVVTQLVAFGDGDDEVSFSDITVRCRQEFPDMFVGSVHFDQANSEWRDQLLRLIGKR